ELVRLLQSLVLVLQRAFDIDAVGHVHKGQHRLSIGQIDNRVSQDCAVGQLCLTMAVVALVVKAGRGGDKVVPRARSRKSVTGGLQQGDVDVAIDELVRNGPQPTKSRVGQAQPSVLAKYSNAFGQIVESFTLHLHNRI